MRRLVAFWTFTCARCNRKESEPATFSESRRVDWMTKPPLWTIFMGEPYCPDCSRIIQEAVCPSKK